MPPFNAKPQDRKASKEKAELINATPEPADGAGDGPARNITDTKAWKSSRRGARRFLVNYKKLLQDSFNNMSREEQEGLISRFCVIITMGVTVLLLLAFSSFLPREMRVLGIPIALFVAWFLGSRTVTDVMLDRLDGIMKKE